MNACKKNCETKIFVQKQRFYCNLKSRKPLHWLILNKICCPFFPDLMLFIRRKNLGWQFRIYFWNCALHLSWYHYSFDLKRKIDPQKAEYKNSYLVLDSFSSFCRESGGVVQSEGSRSEIKSWQKQTPHSFLYDP